ncbi:MAG TPA: hypothetical protein VFT22_32365 [Kofleriaceae bacterium]|nr:hypothetical protein [Kofleriaceae bacterium]
MFVVELDAHGHVVLAKSLGLCGDGIEGLAVARDRRIAISGTAMGTVVLDRSGNVILQLAESGRLAFTSQGELAIAGIDANGQPAVMLVDRGGIAIFDQVFPASVTLTGVAIDATGDIVAVGISEASFDLFGSEVFANYENQVRISGAFGVKFDPAGNAVLATQLFVAFANDVAIGADGLPYFAATTRGFIGPDVEGSGLLGRIDNASSVTFFGVGQLFRGGYDALAVDACGSFVLGGAGFQDPAVPTTNALVVKVSL